MKPNVFISYKSEEYHYADKVRFSLEQSGVSCWMAPDCIGGGSSYAAEIPKAIRECKVFVLILTKKSQESQWVKRELDRAINEKKLIMPFIPEKMDFNDDITFYLTNVQQFFAYRDWDRELDRMINQICAELGIERIVPEPPKPIAVDPSEIPGVSAQPGGPEQIKDPQNDKRKAKSAVNNKSAGNTNRRKIRTRSKLLIAALSVVAALAVAAAIGISVYFSTTVEICGHRYNRNISTLKLNEKSISSASFNNITTLENLNHLELTGCRFDSDIKSLSNLSLKKIYNLVISDCEISNELFNSLDAEGSKITTLDISGNPAITDPAILENLDKLTTLNMNDVSVSSLDRLSKCIYLENLSANGCELSDVKGLSNTTLITKLNLSNNKLSSLEGLEGNAATLKKLYLSENNISDTTFLGTMSSVEYLDISHNAVSDLSPLNDNTHLKSIDASYNKIKSLDADDLSDYLTYVDLSYNSMEQLDNTLKFYSGNSKLHLNLEGNKLSSVSFKDTAPTPNTFDVINLHGCKLDDMSSVYDCKQIRNLTLDYNENLNFEKLKNCYYIYILDCPLAAQVSVSDQLKSVLAVKLLTTEEYNKDESLHFNSLVSEYVLTDAKG